MLKNRSLKFKEALGGRILVFDGAMGTELYRHHVFTNRCFEELNLTDAGLISEITASYRDAGADVLTTNTFGANRIWLEKYGIADRLADINRAGVSVAIEVAGGAEDIFIAGSVGQIYSAGYSDSEVEGFIVEQVDVLWESGVDFIIFETQLSREAMRRCVLAMSKRVEIPFVLSCAILSGDESAVGESVSSLLAPFDGDVGQLIAVGMNCGSGPDGLLQAAEVAVKVNPLPLIVQPNAGMPKTFGGRQIYYSSPEYIASYAMRLVQLGVAAVGGCCGISPEHISEIAKMIKPLAKARVTQQSILQKSAAEVEEKAESRLCDRSRFAWKLARGEWVTSVEVVPPRGYDLGATIEKSKQLHRQGVDAINLPDGPRASSRISSIAVASRILREAHIEPILHFCCRDKNLIGMQADLLGCAALGIRNLLFITGDPPKIGAYPNATGVFDTDSVGICSLQRRLNRGVDLGGQEISPTTDAVIGVGLDPTSLDCDREIDRFKRKIDAGAVFAITQPVFDPEALLRFLDKIGDCPIPIIAGIYPLVSLRNAEFMQNEVPGVVVPELTIDRMAKVAKQSKEDQIAEGIEIAREMVAAVKQRVNGIQVSAPFGKIEIALKVLKIPFEAN
ncbi:MAG: bifunctional homocysteine S-methyltransferase/methylenetetrahydrofolate reductase [Planctomycetaceae bacterium]|jgi:homocysteine S-methyltransferase|nr:bifunctional homocysteine S-methyltransferase/methylenetetrahydrofolate reductase [Planctomycetaceae bacterium]